MSKFYVITHTIKGDRVEGPFSFNEANKLFEHFKAFGISSVIAKTVINEMGDTVK